MCFVFIFVTVVLNAQVYAATSLFKRIEKADHQFGSYFQFSKNDDGIFNSTENDNHPRYEKFNVKS